jgi:hypothetical protein
MAGVSDAKKKRPLDEASDPCDKLRGLAAQIEAFEDGPPTEAKKPAKIHSLTGNTTHRKIR